MRENSGDKEDHQSHQRRHVHQRLQTPSEHSGTANGNNNNNNNSYERQEGHHGSTMNSTELESMVVIVELQRIHRRCRGVADLTGRGHPLQCLSSSTNSPQQHDCTGPLFLGQKELIEMFLGRRSAFGGCLGDNEEEGGIP